MHLIIKMDAKPRGGCNETILHYVGAREKNIEKAFLISQKPHQKQKFSCT